MMIDYSPTELYNEIVIVMEMLCVSVCFTFLICFGFEKEDRGNIPMDEKTYTEIFIVWLHVVMLHLLGSIMAICVATITRM